MSKKRATSPCPPPPTGPKWQPAASLLKTAPASGIPRNSPPIWRGWSRKPARPPRPISSRARKGRLSFDFADSLTDVVKTLTKVSEYWMAEPERALDAQQRLFSAYLDVWATSLKRMMGEPAPAAVNPDPRDNRFADSAWSENQFFDVLKQFYLITSRWAEQMVDEAKDLDPQDAPQGRLLRQADRGGARAIELRLHQPGSASPDTFVGCRQPGARHAHARRRHQGRRRRPQDPPVRPEQVQARREHRHHAGQGRPPERRLPAHSVPRRPPRRS